MCPLFLVKLISLSDKVLYFESFDLKEYML